MTAGLGPTGPRVADAGRPPAPRSLTERLRTRIEHVVPPGQALPDRQPAYVHSWVYVFGVTTLAAFVVVLVSGGVLALGGVTWWHTSSIGHFFNSLHLWSVEIFFAAMVIHLWGKFWMAAWRGGRSVTWMTGVLLFLASIGTAFTGYLSQTNFDSQWISTQAKDGLNSVGIGAFFNVLDTGQMLMWHIVLLPFLVGVITVWHVVLVRRHGVVPPIEAEAAPIQAEAAPPVKAEPAAPIKAEPAAPLEQRTHETKEATSR